MKKIFTFLILIFLTCLFGCVKEEIDVFENYVYASEEDVNNILVDYRREDIQYSIPDNNIGSFLWELHKWGYALQLLKISDINYYVCAYSNLPSKIGRYNGGEEYFSQLKWLSFNEKNEIPFSIGDYNLRVAYSVRDYVFIKEVINNIEFNVLNKHYFSIDFAVLKGEKEEDNISGYYLNDSYKILTIDEYLKSPYNFNFADIRRSVGWEDMYQAIIEGDDIYLVVLNEKTDFDGNKFEHLKYYLSDCNGYNYYDYLLPYLIEDESLNYRIYNGDRYCEYKRVKINIKDIVKMIEEIDE